MNNIGIVTIIMIVIPIILVLITIYWWYKYGRDKHTIETIEFYPPKINSLELALLYNGEVSEKDVMTLFPYLANKGYIKILKNEDNSIFAQPVSYHITKLKEYDGDNKYEKELFDKLFLDDYGETKQSINTSELKYDFYIKIIKIGSSVNKEKSKIFDEKATKRTTYVTLMIIATYILISLRPSYENFGTGTLILALTFPVAGFLIAYMNYSNRGISKEERRKNLFMGSLIGLVSWLGSVLPGLFINIQYVTIYIVGIVCIIIMILFTRIMSKRTNYGNELFGKIKGFKTFLETAEKQKFDELVAQDPTYFYDIMPYAYALNVSNKWMLQFGEDIMSFDEGDAVKYISDLLNSISKSDNDLINRLKF